MRHYVPILLETLQEAMHVLVEHSKLHFLPQHRVLVVQVYGIPSLLLLRPLEFIFNSISQFLLQVDSLLRSLLRCTDTPKVIQLFFNSLDRGQD